MLTIIDYGMGNLNSVTNAFRKLGITAVLSSDIAVIRNADKLILPGVGHFGSGMANLRKYKIIDILIQKVIKDKVPILGICLGMQLFSEWGEEGNCQGLSWIKGRTVRFKFDKESSNLKIPHMGWNTIKIEKNSPILTDISPKSYFYFAHSYHLICKNKADTLITTKYGYEFTSMLHKDNMYGTQFHPEKSHKNGLQLLKNFVEKV